jgi:hypothetical protein
MSGRLDWIQITVLLAVFAAVVRGINPTWLILAAGLIGVVRWRLG